MGTIIKDIEGNSKSDLNAVNGTTIIDTRPNTSNIALLNAEIFIDVTKEEYGSLDVRGTFVATMIVEFAVDGTNYSALPVFNRLTESFLTSITGVGVFNYEIPTGTKRIRLRCSAYTSGTAIVAMTANVGNTMFFVKNIPSNLAVTATGVSGAGVTLTIPSSAGLFHYITQIRIEKFAVATLTAGTTPVIGTTTNLAGSRAYSFDASAQVQGTIQEKVDRPTTPIKSAVAGTNTTIVLPATTNVIWRATVDYYLGF